MRFCEVVPLALVAAASVASAQEGDQAYIRLQGIVDTFNRANLTAAAEMSGRVLNTTEGRILLSEFEGTPKTAFVTKNAGLAQNPNDLPATTSELLQFIRYCNVNTSITDLSGDGGHILYRTLYQNHQLPNNATQPIVIQTGPRPSILLLNYKASIVGGPIAFADYLIYVIDQGVILPQTFSQSAGSLYPGWADPVRQANILQPLEAIKGVTVFAPIDPAISKDTKAYNALNTTAQNIVLANHIINGSSVFSTQFAFTNSPTSAAGSIFVFTSNSSGDFVTSGGSAARIVRSDIIISNGVLHLIDRVLINPVANQSAVNDAQSSYSEAATATGSGFLGPPTTSSASSVPPPAVNVGAVAKGVIGAGCRCSALPPQEEEQDRRGTRRKALKCGSR